MSCNLDTGEYRYMDNTIKKNREIALKRFLIDKETDDLQFYDLNMYHKKNTFSSIILSQTNKSVINNDIILNQYQMEILNILNENNLFLSAPTSFGKTFLMLEFIKRNTKKLNNIIFIIPTLALMNELLKKIYNLFGDVYNICINSSEEIKDKNIFVFVPERSEIDFLVFDEIYKLQASNLKEIKTDDRIIYMNKVYLDLVNRAEKIALLGPYIKNVTFGKTKLDIVKYYTNFMPVYNKMIVLTKEEDWINFIKLEHQLIYFSSPGSIYKNIENILKKIPENQKYIDKYNKEIKYLEKSVSADWYVVSLLKRGIGIHHGKTPMYLRKFYENEYNKNNIKVLLCTNTLMEGINTPTNSLIVVDDPKSAFKLNNLIGRVGRLNLKNPTIGEIIISNESILSNINDSSGWFDLNILAEDNKINDEDEIIYLNKRYEDVSKQKALEEKINILQANGITLEDIIVRNLQFNKAYQYITNKVYEDLHNGNQLIDFVKIGLNLFKPGPGYNFKTEKYNDINYNGEYLPYKYYLVDLLLNKTYKQIVDNFNNKYNLSRDKENINLFIDSLYELNNFIKFKFYKFVNYIELYKDESINNNKQLQQFIGILANYKSLDTAYKILDDLGINEEDSKKILELLNITNIVSTSLVIKLIRKNKDFLLHQDLTPFTKNNISNI
mgnify:FL=1